MVSAAARNAPDDACSAQPLHPTPAAGSGSQRPIHWVNTPVLAEALDRFEQGRLPRSLALWLAALMELERPASGPLRRGGC